MEVYKKKKKKWIFKKGSGRDGKYIFLFFFLTTLSHVRFGFWGEGELHPKTENVLYAISKNQHFTENGVNILKQIVCETKK